MSLDGYVFFNRTLHSMTEWQRAIDRLGFQLTLASDRDLSSLDGHLPAWLGSREAGFECSLIDLNDVQQTYDDVDFGGPWSSAMAFYYDPLAGCAGAWIAIAAWAFATDGIAFDPQAGTVMSAQAAVSYAREGVETLPRFEKQIAELGLIKKS